MSRLDSRLNAVTPTVLSVFRIVIGLLFICHATQKLFGWPTGPRVSVGTWPFWWAGIIELVVLYCFAFLLLAFAGPGWLAVDHFIRRGAPDTVERADRL